MRRLGLGLAWTSLAVGCAGAPTPQALEPGAELCYRFERNVAAEALDLPAGLVLARGLPRGMETSDGRFRAASLAADGGRGDEPFATWRPVSGDSIQVDPLYTGSLQLRLLPVGDRLEGLGRFIGDALEPQTQLPAPVPGVVAEATPCAPGRPRGAGDD